MVWVVCELVVSKGMWLVVYRVIRLVFLKMFSMKCVFMLVCSILGDQVVVVLGEQNICFMFVVVVLCRMEFRLFGFCRLLSSIVDFFNVVGVIGVGVVISNSRFMLFFIVLMVLYSLLVSIRYCVCKVLYCVRMGVIFG